MLLFRAYKKIAKTVVGFYLIDVVYGFPGFQNPSKFALVHESMLIVPTFTKFTRVLWNPYQDVATTHLAGSL